MGGGDRRVSGKGQFAHRREDADAVVRFGRGRFDEEHRFRQVHLPRDSLHDLPGDAIGVEHHGSGVAMEGAMSEDVHLDEVDGHELGL